MKKHEQNGYNAGRAFYVRHHDPRTVDYHELRKACREAIILTGGFTDGDDEESVTQTLAENDAFSFGFHDGFCDGFQAN
jgi:hypothetical protein